MSIHSDTQFEILQGGTRVFTSVAHKITSDSLRLLAFCDMPKNATLCDLGTGCGILLLGLLGRGVCSGAVGLDIQPTATALLQKAITENGFENATALCCDFCEYKPAKQFDVVISNPPYFSTGRMAEDDARATARHQQGSTIAQVCATASRLLKDKGRFYLCWPARSLQSLFAALQAANLAPKQLQFVRKTPASSAWLALVQARKAAGEQLEVLPDVIL